jgi:hypothetical protein
MGDFLAQSDSMIRNESLIAKSELSIFVQWHQKRGGRETSKVWNYNVYIAWVFEKQGYFG